MWPASSSLKVGGIYKTPFNARLKKEETTISNQRIDAFSYYEENSSDITRDLEMSMPQSYGIGISYRDSDKWTLALDFYITDWSQFVLRDSQDNETNPINGSPISDGRLKDTIQVRAGTEYLFINATNVISLRFGVFYDPEPQTGHIDEYYGFSAGTGIVHGITAIDISYQYRAGNNLTGDFPTIQGTNVDIEQQMVMLSTIIYL